MPISNEAATIHAELMIDAIGAARTYAFAENNASRGIADIAELREAGLITRKRCEELTIIAETELATWVPPVDF
jgi:hypothetical protein